MLRENPGVGMVDGSVKDFSAFRKHGSRRCGEGAESGGTHLGPARPAVVEPPIVMMAHQCDVAVGADVGEFAGEEQVAPDSKVVRPHETISDVGTGEDFCKCGADSLGHAPGRAALFGEIAEGRFDRHLNGHARQLPGEAGVPLAVVVPAGGDHHARDGARRFANQVRQGKFNDAPDAARAKVIMNDDQPHNPGSFADGERRSTVCGRAAEIFPATACE